MGEGGTDEETR